MFQKVNCDHCEKDFFIVNTKKKLFQDGLKGKVIFHYFDCPFCKNKYTIHVESEQIKKLLKKQKKLREKIPQAILDDELEKKRLDKIYAEMDENAEKIKSLQAEYKAIFKLDEK
ncbi:hypothetical protein B4065_0151 [Caldibacillus thermoamylovorans]|uniref:hypothetical protein n=1 Tax=Caldibacillus thermoamylovorans TaxID=35841 RepID=UPI0005A49BA9|nr:hypothetical protein [Caldibacillus thermoamylovorans]KIO60225.1 hypothetical protein B4065_0151 [Caldibacillus thermoamylovorans]